MITCTKVFTDVPFAHRQHKHGGHCRFIHGHNWSFEFTFVAKKLDECGFVVDFGALSWLKNQLLAALDHALVLNSDDPLLEMLGIPDTTSQSLPAPWKAEIISMAQVLIVPDCSCEGLCKWLAKWVGEAVKTHTQDRVALLRVKVFEDSKNSATLDVVCA